jgi:hypothetical protein
MACSAADAELDERPTRQAVPPASVTTPPVAPAPEIAPARTEVVLAPGTALETTCTVIDSGRAGEVVLVLAGIHGDEPAPPVAASRIRGWSVVSGRLLVVPKVNPPALSAGTRHTPGDKPFDLNRHFPGSGRDAPEEGMASAIWSLLARERVTWLVDLHEGWDFHRINPRSVGSSVTYVPGAPSAGASKEMATFVLDAINGADDPPRHPFVLLSPGPARSVARAVSEQRGLRSLVIETTKLGQPLDKRVTQHERAVREVLTRLGMLDAG